MKRAPFGALFSCPHIIRPGVIAGMTNIQHSLLEKDGKYIVDITVPGPLVETAMNAAAQAIAGKAEVPGFRPGAAPLAIVRQHYAPQLKAQVSSRLVQEATRDALRTLQISAGARPMVLPEFRPAGIRKWVGRFELNGAFKFAVATDVPPAVTTVDIDGITVTPHTDDPSAVVDEQLHHLRHDLAIKSPSNQPSTELDEIICSIVALDENGQALPEMSLASFPLSLDLQKEALLSRTMAAQLIDKRPGDQVEFSEDGLTYRISIEAVNTKTLPVLNDALAQQCGVASLQELRDRIHEEWLLRNAARIRRDLHMQVREQLVAKNPFQIPESWAADYREKVQSLADFSEALQENEERAARFAQICAASDYLLEILEEKFASEVQLSDADLLNYAKEELGVSGVKPQDYIKVMLAKGQYDSWVLQQKKTKTLDWLITRAK